MPNLSSPSNPSMFDTLNAVGVNDDGTIDVDATRLAAIELKAHPERWTENSSHSPEEWAAIYEKSKRHLNRRVSDVSSDAVFKG